MYRGVDPLPVCVYTFFTQRDIPRTSEGSLPYAPDIGVSISTLGYSESFDSGSPRFNERATGLVALRRPFLRPDGRQSDGGWFEKELFGKEC